MYLYDRRYSGFTVRPQAYPLHLPAIMISILCQNSPSNAPIGLRRLEIWQKCRFSSFAITNIITMVMIIKLMEKKKKLYINHQYCSACLSNCDSKLYKPGPMSSLVFGYVLNLAALGIIMLPPLYFRTLIDAAFEPLFFSLFII